MNKSALFTAAAGVMIGAATASAAVVELNYNLSNHPDGGIAPPLYGLRLDGLDGTASREFTFDFDHGSIAAADRMMMTITHDDMAPVGQQTTIRIFGKAYGGEDGGSGYVANADVPEGIWDIDYTYNSNVEITAGDPFASKTDPTLDLEFRVTDEDHSVGGNVGTIISAVDPSKAYAMQDKSNGSFSFGFDNTTDHRGVVGPLVSAGWGWVNHAPLTDPFPTHDFGHISASDWLFKAVRKDDDFGGGSDPLGVPEPVTGAMGLIGLAGLGASLRRRRA